MPLNPEEFGASLRQKREEKGLSISEISERTKIHPRFLRAIEQSDASTLPGRVYARAFVKHYAQAVDLDPEAIAQEFDAAFEEFYAAQRTSARKKSVAATVTSKPRKRRSVWPWVVALILLAGLGYVVATAVMGYKLDISQGTAETEPTGEIGRTSAPTGIASLPSSFSPDRTNERDQPTQTEQEPETALSSAAETPTEGDGEETKTPPPADVENGETTPSPGEQEPPLKSDRTPQYPPTTRTGVTPPAPQGGSAPAKTPQAEPAGGAVPAEFSSAEENQPPKESVAGVALAVEVERTCWFNVSADGAPLFSGTLQPGETITWNADRELEVKFGRPEGVRLTLNGEYIGSPGTGVITKRFYSDGSTETVESR